MSSISLASSQATAYLPGSASPGADHISKKPADSSSVQAGSPDSVYLSPGTRDLIQTGRIALNVKAGNITSSQASQLYSQVSVLQKQIAADKAANGGSLNASDVQSLEQTATQTSQQIYSAAHDGATPSSGTPAISEANLRNISQTARIGLDVKAGNLTSTQASGFYSQIQATAQQIKTDQLGNNGPLTAAQAAAIDQTQSLLSTQINSLA